MLKKHWFTKEHLEKYSVPQFFTIPDMVKLVRAWRLEDGEEFASLSDAVHDVTRLRANEYTFRKPGTEQKDFLFNEAGKIDGLTHFELNPDFDWDNYEVTMANYPERNPEDATEDELLRIVAKKCYEHFKLDSSDSPESKMLPDEIKNFLSIWRRRFC